MNRPTQKQAPEDAVEARKHREKVLAHLADLLLTYEAEQGYGRIEIDLVEGRATEVRPTRRTRFDKTS
jgi:hypothetical protein